MKNNQKLYRNTENKEDIVTLEEIKGRYVQINGSAAGFQEYVQSDFFDGRSAEYQEINE